MSETSKAQKIKLANSRKKFKELQELKKKRNVTENQPVTASSSDVQTNVESLTSSTHSSLNDSNTENAQTENPANIENQLPNYFNDNTFRNAQQSLLFFDNLPNQSSQNPNIPYSNMYDYLNSTSPQTVFVQNMVSDVVQTPKVEVQYTPNYSLFSQENKPSFLDETQQIIHPSQDNVTIDDPEIKQNEIQERFKQAECDMLDNIQNSYTASANLTSHSLLAPSFDNESTLISSPQTENHSSIESLKQLSNQISQAIEPEYGEYSNSITDLEKRNLELAALLEQEKLNSEQQKLLINELKSQIAQLKTEQQSDKEQLLLHSSNEISRLKEELQCHIQTVGLLVAEKTELAAALSQMEITCKQKISECEELQARLKASRSRVADLERENNNLKSEKNKNDSNGREQNEMLLKLQNECTELREKREELVQDLLEVREKLKNSLEENLKLQNNVQETSNKLSLAELKIQQITAGKEVAVAGEVEQLTVEKFELEKQLAHLNTKLKTIIKERDEASAQYQQYAEQLNAQITNLSNQIEYFRRENENLSMQDQNRIKHISELERQLQNLQNEQVAFATTRTTGDDNLKSDLESTRELCIQLQMEKTIADENLTKALNEKEMLLKELMAKNDSLSQLESMIEQLQGNQPDSVKLLAAMESDKVAASRAVQQNKELKQQMESMQEVFMKLDNDKVDLTEKLSIEQAGNKELLEKLQKVELHVQRLTDAIEIKDRELSTLRETTLELRQQVMQHEHIADRLRHYEAQDNSSHVLQHELQEAKQTILKLTNEINGLKSEMHKARSTLEKSPLDDNGNENVRNHNKEEVDGGSESEHNKPPVESENPVQNQSSNESSSLDREAAMKCLEEKFKNTMQEIADLTEEKQRLEHLVLQLQGETETIGEYVALYQRQRMVLKQKAIEKDQQLKQLASDREQMKTKLEKLNELIRTLVNEKGQVPTELLQQHQSLTTHSDHFCEEHSKLHQEINKINDNSAPSGDGSTNETSETAKQIIELLSEIKSSSLVQNEEDIHHCAWCSGKLITV